MEENIKKYLIWIVVFVVVAVVFYILCPKYYFIIDYGVWHRCNEITGTCEYFSDNSKWIPR
ncbi:MAG: hypothetical protein A2312_00375 [Candidatus Staskawiczbacteria bacterium RIFOXYB2_FULL_32_9]|uniref:Uncharacterized protein n=1 Tax=Candidatus Staskawiczbacteria bacterium RIFOXYD1_FULL_32_13 TaxID=1802234 RepID=A0A1G2JKN9_9BACT|nr:MAG: hypothetical protein UR22_C0001G0060 [Parcubacteria group bacterium GW2011_GWC2_32_10]OGZ77562.1 MAG: hypothetical protein A2256_02265 [Candidatus Staskawiczbacteria bacterium RIFOXYA2_FULL_32_7]OGZ78264.1 MAG: hypothetical protein A2360_03795 [Candidatus Staskawiczbacteria bacterium RIFOXYB1_FULL_32_11]OGZ84549.1 MAG: hypothetical protein A2312_00375 [Candidatus Staskawiczbacteria bacterium RIFOXYB2_FULL_32_9]OGZ87243.1 MAG: hypothetical protein A2463_02680 [Candidatus Staskawiczbacter